MRTHLVPEEPTVHYQIAEGESPMPVLVQTPTLSCSNEQRLMIDNSGHGTDYHLTRSDDGVVALPRLKRCTLLVFNNDEKLSS